MDTVGNISNVIGVLTPIALLVKAMHDEYKKVTTNKDECKYLVTRASKILLRVESQLERMALSTGQHESLDQMQADLESLQSNFNFVLDAMGKIARLPKMKAFLKRDNAKGIITDAHRRLDDSQQLFNISALINLQVNQAKLQVAREGDNPDTWLEQRLVRTSTEESATTFIQRPSHRSSADYSVPEGLRPIRKGSVAESAFSDSTVYGSDAKSCSELSSVHPPVSNPQDSFSVLDVPALLQFPLGTSQSKSNPTKKALLIGIDKYPNLPVNLGLQGCRNDVVQFAGVLCEEFEFADVRVMTDEFATRAKILTEMENFVHRIEVDDVAVFMFCGHGSWRRDRSSPSTRTMTIVPHDSCHSSPTAGGHSPPAANTDITFMELCDTLLAPLAAKTSHIVCIFDCCHFGSTLRNPTAAHIRGIDLDVNPSASQTHGLTPFEGSGHESWSRHESKYVLLSACRASEQAAEREHDDGTFHGQLTYELCAWLKWCRHHLPNATWHELFQLIGPTVSVNSRAGVEGEEGTNVRQHPVLEGSTDALLFSRVSGLPRRFLKVISVSEHIVHVEGGLAHGVTKFAQYMVIPFTASEGAPDILTVTEVNAFDAHATPASAVRSSVRPGSLCVPMNHLNGVEALQLRIEDADIEEIATALLPEKGGRPTSEEDAIEFANELRARAAPLTAETADVTIRKEDAVMIASTSWMPEEYPRQQRFLFSCHPSLLLENLRKFAWYQHAISLQNGVPGHLEDKIRLEVGQRAQRGKPWTALPANELHVFKEHAQIAFRITNTSTERAWPYIFDFAEDGTIQQLYPQSGGDQCIAAGDMTGWVAGTRLRICDSMRTTGDVIEIVKLFAATEALNLDFLTQSSYVAVPINAAVGPGTTRRAVVSAKLGAWETASAAFRITL